MKTALDVRSVSMERHGNHMRGMDRFEVALYVLCGLGAITMGVGAVMVAGPVVTGIAMGAGALVGIGAAWAFARRKGGQLRPSTALFAGILGSMLGAGVLVWPAATPLGVALSGEGVAVAAAGATGATVVGGVLGDQDAQDEAFYRGIRQQADEHLRLSSSFERMRYDDEKRRAAQHEAWVRQLERDRQADLLRGIEPERHAPTPGFSKGLVGSLDGR